MPDEISVQEVERFSNARTGFNEPAEVGRYEVTRGDLTRRVVIVRLNQFRTFGSVMDPPEWGYECWAFEATEEWDAKSQRSGHIFHFSTAQEVTWKDLEEELQESEHYLFPMVEVSG